MDNLFIQTEHLNMLRDIFQSYCPKAEIWAYGSRLNGNAHEGSDLDLVIKSFNEEEKYLFELKEILNESNIPFIVDIHEYNYLPDSFKEEILKKYLIIFPQKKQ